MNNSWGYILAFSAGVAVGGFAAWRLLKTKYEQIAQKEIDSVKEVFSRDYIRKTVEREEKPVEEIEEKEVEMKDYRFIKQINEYESDFISKVEDKKSIDFVAPYVISPEEYGDGDNDIETLTYYADGILVDENDDIIEDIDAVVGRDSLDTFGQYEDDSVFVRNDRLGTDYEILRDIRTYSAAANFDASLREAE